MEKEIEEFLGKASDIFYDEGLPRGRIISSYKESPKGHVCVFNGNIVLNIGETLKPEFVKIWYGDLDVTKSMEQLKKIANKLKKDLWIVREHDARFEKESHPDVSNPVAIIKFEEIE